MDSFTAQDCSVDHFDFHDRSEKYAMSNSEIMFSADSYTKRSSARISNFGSSAQTSFRSSVVNEASVASEFEFNQENASMWSIEIRNAEDEPSSFENKETEIFS